MAEKRVLVPMTAMVPEDRKTTCLEWVVTLLGVVVVFGAMWLMQR
jgi:hypothetical protein